MKDDEKKLADWNVKHKALETKMKKLKDAYDSTIEDKMRAEGRMSQIMETLKRDFGVDTIKKARKLLDDKQILLEKETEKLEKLVAEIENEFDW